MTYLTDDGTTYSRTLVAPANSRSGIWVDQEQFPGVRRHAAGQRGGVDDGAVDQRRAAGGGAGDVVARRQQHLARGAQLGRVRRSTGTRWAVAEGEVGGARGHETYLLIANTSAFAGSATVTLLFEDGTSAGKTYALPPSSRTNVAVGPAFGAAVTGRRFGAVIESTGTTPAQIVVERAMYSSAAGSALPPAPTRSPRSCSKART